MWCVGLTACWLPLSPADLEDAWNDDPAADACWQLEYIDDGSMTLRDVMGDQGQVEFTRLPPEN
mgnify:CR=1 FL=1